jgi:hypothetical protein
MPKGSRKFVVLTFVVVTAILVGTMLYSFYEYLGIFTAVRSLRLSIHGLDLAVLDPTRAVVTTTVDLNNTSGYEFYVTRIDVKVWMNSIYVGSCFKADISSSHPFQVFAGSNNNFALTIDLDLGIIETISPQLVEMILDADHPKSWEVYALAGLDGPLLGRFSMDDYQNIAPA